jgi:hypothetical protein
MKADPPVIRPTLLFVHGAWHGSSFWELVRQILAERGWTTAASQPAAVADIIERAARQELSSGE